MNRIDRAVVGGLILILVLAAVVIGGPALAPSTRPHATPSGVPVADVPPYREGVVSRPTGVNPLAARTQADRDLVALVFQGLVGRDADGRPIPALARSWTTTPAGDDWTFELDPGARWQDGEPVTADDVVFTVETIQAEAYRGPGAGSWVGVAVSARTPTTVAFHLATPIGGFLDLATQPIVPRHLLEDTSPGAMPDAAFGEAPIGSGPYVVVELDRDHAVLELASATAAPSSSASPSASDPIDPLATPGPTRRPADGRLGLQRIELRFFDDAASLTAAFRAGNLDVASGLDPAAAIELATASGATTIRDPSTTVTAVALNLRPTQVAFNDPRMRRALLQAIDRARVVTVAYGGAATRADGLVPPSSWAYSSAASPAVSRDLSGAAKNLTAAGWKKAKDGWHLGAAKAPQTLELLVPDRQSNPILYAAGSQIAADWKALGFTVVVEEKDPATIATDHLRTGEFTAALIEIAIGHDPDLYPLLASSQTRTGGANVIGLQDPILDGLLEKARQPGTDVERMTAFAALQQRLAGGTYLLPIAWPEVVTVVSPRVVGMGVRTVSDGSERFGDVLTWRLADDR